MRCIFSDHVREYQSRTTKSLSFLFALLTTAVLVKFAYEALRVLPINELRLLTLGNALQFFTLLMLIGVTFDFLRTRRKLVLVTLVCLIFLSFANGVPLQAQAVSQLTRPQVVQTPSFNFNIAPHLIQTASGCTLNQGCYIYVTPAGNYTFPISLPWLLSSYTSLIGNNSISFASWGVMEGSTTLLPLSSAVLISNNTYFSVQVSEFSGATNHGSLVISYNFNSFATNPSKLTSLSYVEASGITNNYNLIGIVAGYGYASLSGSSTDAVTLSSQPSLVSLSTAAKKVLMSSSTTAWSKALLVDFSDFGNVQLLYGHITYNSVGYYAVVAKFPTNTPIVDPTVVQTITCTTSCTFSSNTASGNTIVVAVQLLSSTTTCATASITDTQTLTYTSTGSTTASSATQCATVYIFSSTATSAAADTLTITAACSGCTPTVGGTEAVEVSGITATGATTQTGSCTSSCTSPTSTTSLSWTGSPFIIASEKGWGANSGTTPGADTGFTLLSQDGGDNAEYSTTVASPSTFKITFSVAPTNWVEISAQFPKAVVTLPVQCTMSNSATQLTVTLSGGTTPNPSTVLCDGLSHNVTVDASITITATEPADGANTRGRFSGGGTTITVQSCSSGTCTTWSFTNYYELQNSFQFSLSVGTTTAGLAWTYTGTLAGAGSSTICTSSPSAGLSSGSCTGWSDYNLAVTAPAEPTGEAANERFRNSADATSTAATPTTGGNTFTVTYYRQESTTVGITQSGTAKAFDGVINFAITKVYLGTAGTAITLTPANLATTPVDLAATWVDYNSVISYPATSSSNPANLRYQNSNNAASTSSAITTAGTTVRQAYYAQWSTIAGITQSGTTRAFDGIISFAVTYTYLGTAGTADTITPSNGATTPVDGSSIWVDHNTQISFPATSANNPASVRYQNSNNAASQSAAVTSGGTTVRQAYYAQLSNTYAANPNIPTTFSASITFVVTGTYLGAASTTICTISVPVSPGAGVAYNCSGYADYNIAVSLPALSTNNPANVNWASANTRTFTDTTGGNTHTTNYNEQLQNTYNAHPSSPSTFSASITFVVTGTSGGVAGSTICTITVPVTPAAQDYGCSGYADYNTVVSFPSASTNNPASTQWTLSGSGTFTDTTGGNTHTANYMEQFSITFAVTMLTGSNALTSSNSATAVFNSLGVITTATPAYPGNNLVKFVDYGSGTSLAGFLKTSSGSTASERWKSYNSNTTTVTGATTITFTFQDELLVNFVFNTSNGGNVAISNPSTFTVKGNNASSMVLTTTTSVWASRNWENLTAITWKGNNVLPSLVVSLNLQSSTATYIVNVWVVTFTNTFQDAGGTTLNPAISTVSLTFPNSTVISETSPTTLKIQNGTTTIGSITWEASTVAVVSACTFNSATTQTPTCKYKVYSLTASFYGFESTAETSACCSVTITYPNGTAITPSTWSTSITASQVQSGTITYSTKWRNNLINGTYTLNGGASTGFTTTGGVSITHSANDAIVVTNYMWYSMAGSGCELFESKGNSNILLRIYDSNNLFLNWQFTDSTSGYQILYFGSPCTNKTPRYAEINTVIWTISSASIFSFDTTGTLLTIQVGGSNILIDFSGNLKPTPTTGGFAVQSTTIVQGGAAITQGQPPSPFPSIFDVINSGFVYLIVLLATLPYGLGLMFPILGMILALIATWRGAGSRPKEHPEVNKVVVERRGGPTALRILLTTALGSALSAGAFVYILPLLGYSKVSDIPFQSVLILMVATGLVAGVLVLIFSLRSTNIRVEPTSSS